MFQSIFNVTSAYLEPVDRNQLFYYPKHARDTLFSERAKDLWARLTSAFVLTENCRYANILESMLANFAIGARVSEPDMRLLDEINYLCLVEDYEDLDRRLTQRDLVHNATCLPSDRLDKRKVVILAATHKVVNKLNNKVRN